jgi:hypothetical protein
MKEKRTIKYLLLITTSVSFGVLLTWVYTFKEDSLKQFFASLSIFVLLIIFHYLSTRLINESILIINSYFEGIIFFVVTIATFRIGDRLLGISSMSIFSDLLLMLLAVICGSAYVWTIRRAYKHKRE